MPAECLKKIHLAFSLHPETPVLEQDLLSISMAATYGQKVNPIGARRSFFVEKVDGDISIRSLNIYTEQLTSRSKRKIVSNWAEERPEPKFRGANQTEKTNQDQ